LSWNKNQIQCNITFSLFSGVFFSQTFLVAKVVLVLVSLSA